MALISKRGLFILISTIVLLIILASAVLYYFLSSSQSETKKFSENVSYQADILGSDIIEKEGVENELAILNKPYLSEEERYNALLGVLKYFDTAYFNSSDPNIREYAKTIDAFASKNFPKYYVKSDFSIVCADATCGEATPPEIQKIMNEIKNLPIEGAWKNSILFNMRVASHIPEKTEFELADKMNSYALALIELRNYGKQDASASAQQLQEYIKNRYGKDL